MSRKSNAVLVIVLLSIFTVAMLFPLYIMFSGSFKSAVEIAENPAGLPHAFKTTNYSRLLSYNSGVILRTYFNSIFITLVYTVLAIFLSSMCAFALSKYHFPGAKVIFFLLLSTMMIPGELTIAPLYLVFSKIHWLDTYQVQILPGVANVFAMFMYKQYIDGLPDSVFEAARIDGASAWQLYARILMPMLAPTTGALAILVSLGKWNEYLWPTMMVNKTAYRPIMAVLPFLNETEDALSIPWEIVLASCTIVTLPIIIVFFMFQNKFMQSVTIGAVKE